jgi:bifunctional DNA-binding transcriptional regulator/antitoxin component of YhaV-PrlF toxin-antitoxin module
MAAGRAERYNRVILIEKGMAMSTVVGTRGQVTIEKEIREALGIEAGWRAIQRLEGDRVMIRFRPPKHRRSLLGILGGPDIPRLDAEDFQKAVERAWDDAAEDACRPQTAAEDTA